MIKAAGKFIDADAGFNQHTIVRARNKMDKRLIGYVRRDDPHVDARLGGKHKRVYQRVIGYQIGGVDIEVGARHVNDVYVYFFACILFGNRAFRVGLREAVACHRTAFILPGIERFKIIKRRFLAQLRFEIPQPKEDQRKRPCAFAADKDRGVLPPAVSFINVDILVANIDAAGKRAYRFGEKRR